MRLLTLLLILFGTEICMGRPSWLSKAPNKSTMHKYYIGRASEVPSEAEAFKQATIDARSQAITENFGVYTQLHTETYQSIEKSQSSSIASEISQQIRLEDFEQEDFYSEKEGDKFSVWILFRYKLSSLEKEKFRLRSINFEKPSNLGTIQAGSEILALNNGSLAVNSYPEGALVRIDGSSKIGELKLRTPLLLRGLFSPGEHTVEIDDPKYEIVVERVNVYPGTTARVERTLIRAKAEILIETDPKGATLFVGSKLVGMSPMKDFLPVLAEVPIDIEIRHPEMETLRRELVLIRGERWSEPFVLTPKPATLAVSSSPSAAIVQVDNEEKFYQTPTGPITLPKGAHKITVTKRNYETYEESFEIKGGEKKVLLLPPLKYKIGENVNTNKQQPDLEENKQTAIDSPKGIESNGLKPLDSDDGFRGGGIGFSLRESQLEEIPTILPEISWNFFLRNGLYLKLGLGLKSIQYSDYGVNLMTTNWSAGYFASILEQKENTLNLLTALEGTSYSFDITNQKFDGPVIRNYNVWVKALALEISWSELGGVRKDYFIKYIAGPNSLDGFTTRPILEGGIRWVFK